jgi:hypothetical protein
MNCKGPRGACRLRSFIFCGFAWAFELNGFWPATKKRRRPHSALGAGGASEDGFAAAFDRCARKSEVIAALPFVHRICAL